METQELTPDERKDAIKAARTKGILQTDIAKAIGISDDHLSKLLNRKSKTPKRSRQLAILDQWLRHNVLTKGRFIPESEDFAERGELPGITHEFFQGLTQEERTRLGLEIRAFLVEGHPIQKLLDILRQNILTPGVPPHIVPGSLEIYYHFLKKHFEDVATFLIHLGAIKGESEIKMSFNLDRWSLNSWRNESESDDIDNS